MSKDSAVLAVLAIGALTVFGAWLVDEASKKYCAQCQHRHKENEQHIWAYPTYP